MKVVICSGGTGGHIFPAQALAEALIKDNLRSAKEPSTLKAPKVAEFSPPSGSSKNRLKDEVYFYTDARSLRHLNDLPPEVKIHMVSTGKYAGVALSSKLKGLFFMGLGLAKVVAQFIFKRPSVVVSFGGYVSVPVVSAATLLRIPIILHEQNAVLGKANRLFAGAAKYIVSGFPLVELPVKLEAKTKLLGIPVREEFLSARKQRCGHFAEVVKSALGLDSSSDQGGAASLAQASDKKHILILGGSQGARILGSQLVAGFKSLDAATLRDLVIHHQCREEQLDETYYAWQELQKSLTVQLSGPVGPLQVEVKPFFHNVAELLQKATLIISRAGASTIAEVTCVGVPAIYVPLANAIQNHQVLNALTQQRSGAAWIIKEQDFNSMNLSSALVNLLKSDKLQSMGLRAKKSFKTHVIEDLLQLVRQAA